MTKKEEDGDYLRHTPAAESQIAPQVATDVIGAFEMHHASRHQPLDLDLDPRVHNAVEVAACVFQGQEVGVHQVLVDEEVDLGR